MFEVLEKVLRKFSQIVPVEAEPPQVGGVPFVESVARDRPDAVVFHLEDGEIFPVRIELQLLVDVTHGGVLEGDADGVGRISDPVGHVGGVLDGEVDVVLQLVDPLTAEKFGAVDLFSRARFKLYVRLSQSNLFCSIRER